MASLAVYVLGAPRIERAGVVVTADTRKAVALLAYLIVTGKPQSRDTLATLLWPDYGQSQARATLRRTLSALNKTLDGPWLVSGREVVSLRDQDDLWTDVAEFLGLLAETQAHEHAPGAECDDCLVHLTAAVGNYGDDFLAGFALRDSETFEEWQFFQREGLRRKLAGALERLVAAYVRRGAFDDAVSYARRWLALDRLHEPAHRALMESYARSGQVAAALRQYRELVRTLDAELGVAPLEATTRLYEDILKRRVEPTTPAAPELVASARVAPVTGVTLAGRADELAALTAAYAGVSGAGRLAVLSGEAGIGKTRLAGEFVSDARARGAIVIEARCYAGETGLAYGPVLALLRDALGQPGAAARLETLAAPSLSEAARLLPDLRRARPDSPAPPPLDTPGAQSRFFDGVCQTLHALMGGAAARGVLLVDDAHWADTATRDFLAWMARRLDVYPFFLLLCWRPEEAASQWPRALLSEARRAGGATLIELARLGPDATRDLVRARLDPGDARLELLARRLYEETEGVPVYLVEYLNAALDGALDLESAHWAAPSALRDALLARVHGVSETAWQALTAAALIGHSFDVDTLRAVSGRGDDEAVAALDELSARGLVAPAPERPGSGGLSYDFSHEKVRAAVRDEVSLARQRLLHRRIAAALASRNPRDQGALAARIAEHYRAAGQDADAAVYFKLAGERARALFANADALTHFETALALSHPDAAALHEAVGDLRTLRGEYSAALRAFETAAALADAGVAPRLEWKLSDVYVRRGDWGLAESHLMAALAGWGETGPVAERSSAWAGWSQIARRQGEMALARERAEKALALATAGGAPGALAQAHNLLGALASGEGHLDDALAHLEQSLELVERLGDISGRVAALNNLALTRVARGEADEARRLADEALRLCVAQGDRHREAALRTNLADLLRASGDLDAAIAQLTIAATIFGNIGADAGELHPEIWKLTAW